MKKLLTVQEYDEITCNREYAEKKKGKAHFLEKKYFDELLNYVEKVIRKQKNFPENKAGEKKPFMEIQYIFRVGNIVKVQNYIGLIQLGSGQRIQIYPKIYFGDGEDKTRKVLMEMLGCMKSFSGWKLSEADLMSGDMNLYDIFSSMYLQEVRRLVKSGLRSGYEEKEQNLTSYRGKLLVSRQIRENMGHGERFFVRYEEFGPNRAENRLIKTTLLMLKKNISSPKQQQEIKYLLPSFEKVDVCKDIRSDFGKVRIDRNSKEYEKLIQWSKVFLDDKSFSCFLGEVEANALLFPMELVYENFVACKLKKYLKDTWEVSAQDTGYTLFETPHRFEIRPDLVLRNGEKCVIMDTKWKILEDDPYHNYKIKSEDMYQMYAYSKRYKAEDIWLLYPLTDWLDKKNDIVYDTGTSDAGFATRIHIFGVDVTNIEASIQELRRKIEK